MMKLVAKITRKYYKREIVEYPEGVVKFESSTPGNYDVDLVSGKYEIICVGAGGGGVDSEESAWSHKQGGGGSGGYSKLSDTAISSGSYDIVVGAGAGSIFTYGGATAQPGGNSTFGNDICVGYGGGGGSASYGGSSGGAGGQGNISNGNNGRTGQNAGGASVYGGYGSGGYCNNRNVVVSGGSGYVKVTCYAEITITPGTAEDYDFYEDIPGFQAVVNNNKLYAFDR